MDSQAIWVWVFSSFFLEYSKCCCSDHQITKERSRKCRKKQSLPAKESSNARPNVNSPAVFESPVDSHQGVSTASSNELEPVEDFPTLFGFPGLKCIENDKEGWTTVKRRRFKKQVQCEADNVASSDSELDVGTAREVRYQERGSIPGLFVRRGCTLASVSWKPSPLPISSRTRSKFK